MQSSRKQPSRRLEKRENSRRWLLIPALCAAVILAVVLIVELNKQPQVLPDNSNTTPVSHDQPTTPDPEPEPDPEPIPELLTLVNPWNQVPEDWTVDLVTLPNGLESCMSRGIIGMSVRSTPRISTRRVSAWNSIWSNGESETLAHAARVEKTMDKHL